jgi:hypothetical protein
MLELSKISHTTVYNDDWRRQRAGKITASPFGKLIGEKSHLGIFPQTAITYIEGLVGELLTGLPAQEEFFNNATNHGNATEPEAIVYFANQLGMFPLRNADQGDTHRLILNDEHSGCTPDALLSKYQDVSKLFDETGTKIKVTPLEVKCPPIHHRFIKLFKCETAFQVKKTEPLYYWQVITQMIFCDSLNAYFGVYSPFFPIPGKLIEFKQVELMEDIKKFNLTLHYAKLELEKTLKLFTLN